MPRLSARTRLLAAVLATSTLVGAACARLNTSGDLRVAAATTHVLVDDPDASIVDRRALPQDVDSLQKRAELYGRLLVTAPVLQAVARRAGLPPDELSGVARTTADVPIPLTEPGSAERASQIRDSRAPYRLELQAEPGEPILSIYAEAPSVAAAQRLAAGAVLGLRDFLQGLARREHFPVRELPRVRRLDDARATVVNARASLVIGGITFVVAFGLTAAVLLAVTRLRRRRTRGEPASWWPAAPPAPAPPPSGADDWPRTTRVLPWTLAGFIAMLWLTPFDKIQLAVSTPIDLKLDRLVLPVVVAIWLLAFASGRADAAPRLRMSPVHLALGAFLACAFLSVVLDARSLNQTGELDLALKKLPLLVSYMSVFLIVASSVRRTEVPAFMTYTLVLAVICALGIIVEYRLDVNVFNLAAEHVLPGGFQFVADGNGEGVDSLGRRWIVGPTGFGVEAVGLMAMTLPIAVVGLLAARRRGRGRKVLYALAIGVLFAGMFATQRKSALLAPVAVILTLAYFRRRELLSLAPLGLVMAMMVALLSPGAVHGVISQFTRADASGVATVSDRTSDYDAIRPDLWTHVLLGRGFGSYDPATYRILDSEILTRVVETGALGLAAFLMVGISVVLTTRRTVAERDPRTAPFALCGTAAAVCFMVLAALFDELGFPHGTYVFLYLIGLVVVVVGPRRPGETAVPERPEHALREPRRPPRPAVGAGDRAAGAG